MKCNVCGLEPDGIMIEKVKQYGVPFKCSACGMLTFPIQAVNGVIMVWPKPVPETHGLIHIPENLRPTFKDTVCMVMSTGGGCIEQRTKKFVKTKVAPGDILSYDKNVPWQLEVADSSGKKHTVDMMNVLDVLATIKE